MVLVDAIFGEFYWVILHHSFTHDQAHIYECVYNL